MTHLPRCMIALIIFLAAPSRGRATDEFVPLAVGKQLTYDVEYIAPSGGLQHADAIMRIESMRTIGKHEYYKVALIIRGIPGADPEITYERIGADGLYELRYIGNNPVEYLSLPIPVKVGKSWSVRTADGNVHCRITSKEPAILPAKTYNDAYKISCAGKRKGVAFEQYVYQVKGIGAVRVVEKSAGLTIEMRLHETNP